MFYVGSTFESDVCGGMQRKLFGKHVVASGQEILFKKFTKQFEGGCVVTPSWLLASVLIGWPCDPLYFF
jgi:hypothetical protein